MKTVVLSSLMWNMTFALLRKIPIKIIADNCGTSQAEIERTYQRINNILNVKDLGFFMTVP